MQTKGFMHKRTIVKPEGKKGCKISTESLTSRSQGEQIDAAPATGVLSPSSPRYLT
jgi:hypothetical protein